METEVRRSAVIGSEVSVSFGFAFGDARRWLLRYVAKKLRLLFMIDNASYRKFEKKTENRKDSRHD